MPSMRKIIEIDEELCNGCGACILGCAEGALELVDGKARLVGEILCDGLGACLGQCPTGALTIIERPAEGFDEEAVEHRLKEIGRAPQPGQAAHPAVDIPLVSSCPSRQDLTLSPAPAPAGDAGPSPSTLGHWPVKLQLMNPGAPFLAGADLLLLADCAAAALPNLHRDFLPGKAVALACPKLDDAQAHVDKLAQVLATAKPRSLTVVHMEVPCCSGLITVARRAVEKAGLDLAVETVTIARNGAVLGRKAA